VPFSRLTSFERLALVTTATTYFLILVGGLVRASGAGLGCPDWPRCFGSWIPPLSAASLPPEFDPAQFNPQLMWTEYLNRLLGVIVGFLIFATTVSAWRHHRAQPRIVWTVVFALILTGFQGWLGGRVVAHELAPWIVTVHLIVALVIVSLLLYATVYALLAARGPVVVRDERKWLARTTLLIMALTVGQVILGTQVRGAVDEALAMSVDRASALSTAGAIDEWHREAALVVLGATLVLVAIVFAHHRTQRPLLAATYTVVALTAGQIGVGLILAYGGLPAAGQVAHLLLASLLLGALTVLLLLARWLPVN
jgi:cytochrome c oxidase assembly protein subunit 15